HDAGERGFDHLEVDRVDHPLPSVTIRFFHSSTRATWPGQITVVQSSWSSTAGPATQRPTSSFSRWYTGQSIVSPSNRTRRVSRSASARLVPARENHRLPTGGTLAAPRPREGTAPTRAP